MATILKPWNLTGRKPQILVGSSKPPRAATLRVVRVCSKLRKCKAGTLNNAPARLVVKPVQTEVSESVCERALEVLRESADFSVVNVSGAESLVQDRVVSESLYDLVGGYASKTSDRYFRRVLNTCASSENVDSQCGALCEELQEELLPAALKVFGEDNNPDAARLSRAYATYANVLLPGQQKNLQLDVPEFRGLDQTNCPSWLLVVARCSGLFEDYRVQNVTGVFYPSDANGGALAVYPHIDGEAVDSDAQVFKVKGGHAVLLNADSHHHHTEPVAATLSDLSPQLPASCALKSSTTADGKTEWTVFDKETSQDVISYSEEQMRFSVSCKFQMFRNQEEVDLYDNGPKLTQEEIVSVLSDEMVRRGKVNDSAKMKGTPVNDLGSLFVEEFVTPTAPSNEAVQSLWQSFRATEVTEKDNGGAVANGDQLELTLPSGASYSFHNMWMRDSCKCKKCSQEGMRPAQMSAHINFLEDIKVNKTTMTADRLEVEWSDDHHSSYPLQFLERIAPYVAKPLNNCASLSKPKERKQSLWKSSAGMEIPHFHIDDIRKSPALYEDFLKSITSPGVCIVKGVPEDPEQKQHTFVAVMKELLGKMNQHPVRDNSHWLISTKDESYADIFKDVSKQSLDYVAKEPLLSHSDHSDYLSPAFIVCMHVMAGQSINSVTDSFAVAEALRERDPEAFELLSTRNMAYARYQAFYEAPLYKWAESPMIQTHPNGDIKLVRHSEGKRTFFQVPHEDFPKMRAAYHKFSLMLEDPEFNKQFPMEGGDVLILNNQRTVHGRVAIPGGYRILYGGTFGKDTYWNRVRGAGIEKWPTEDYPYAVELPMAEYDGHMHGEVVGEEENLGKGFFTRKD